jgi:cyclic patellamide precursor peptide PatG
MSQNDQERRPDPAARSTGSVHPQGCGCAECLSAGAAPALPPSYVYALGRIEARFPSLDVEKEFVQAIARGDATGKTDSQTMHDVLSRPENRYLARRMCWVFRVEGIETYLLVPRDPFDLAHLVEALRAQPRKTDVDVVIGTRGPLAPPEMCNGLIVPVVVFDQLYSFDVETLIKSIPRLDKMPADQFEPAAEELFQRIMQLADNAGATADHRALNYLAVRYPAIYTQAAVAFESNKSLSGVSVRLSRLAVARTVVDVIFTFTHRTTDVSDQYFVRVDVSEEFPFLVTKLSPYFDR